MKTEKRSVLELLEAKIQKGKKIELSFIHDDEEYICISLDVFGSGKPEFVALGHDKFHDAIVISEDAEVNRDRLYDLFRSFPEELELTVIPRDIYEEEII